VGLHLTPGAGLVFQPNTRGRAEDFRVKWPNLPRLIYPLAIKSGNWKSPIYRWLSHWKIHSSFISRRLSIAQEWDDLIPIDSVWSTPYLCGWLKLLSTYVQIVVHCFVTQNPAGVDLLFFNLSIKVTLLFFGLDKSKSRAYSKSHGSKQNHILPMAQVARNPHVWTNLNSVLLSPIIYL